MNLKEHFRKKQKAKALWPLILAYSAAVLGGLVLVLAFARFNALHEEFLGANFDSVHSARTLLKAQFYVDLASRDLADATRERDRRVALLRDANALVLNAANYIEEGRDGDAKARQEITERVRSLSEEINRLVSTPDGDVSEAALHGIATSLRKLGRDLDAAEHDRWGNLAALNSALAVRMRTMNEFIGASLLFFGGVMIVLGWAMLRTRKAESGLRAAKHAIEAIQQTTLDASPLGIAYINLTDMSNRRIEAVNRQMANIFGYDAELMPGLNIRRLFASQEAFDRLSITVPPRLRDGEVVREEIVMQQRDGKPFWCALSIKAIDPGDLSRGVVWNCEDISDRKLAEEELLQARSRAESASRAKSEFLANMSHELRTPFTGLFGLLDLLDRTPLDESQKRYLGFARDSARQMQAIVNDILDFSKIEAGKLVLDETSFDLRALIDSLIETHRTAAETKGLTLTADLIEPAATHLHGDAVRIRQIVDNLIGNAIKFTEKGSVRLIVASDRDDGEAVLRISVADTGIGVAEEMHERIFEKFTQADSSTTRLYGGTGLGLAISRQLAMLMGGSITLVSKEREGSRFTLSLRLKIAQTDTVLPTRHSVAPQNFLQGLTLLLAEDNAINRSMLTELLEHYGATVMTATNGAEAFDLVMREHPDVVLMDCQMPIMDGLEATRRIRTAESVRGDGRRTPIIAVTAFLTTSYRDDCLAAGMDRFVPKPVSLDQLVEEIRALRSPSAETRNSNTRARILLVEDTPAILEATRAILERAGCEVVTASDGESALAAMEKCTLRPQDELDLVLMDRKLPRLDGLEATRRWRAIEAERKLPPLAIIGLTADDRGMVLAECRNAGMDDILSKPFTEPELQALLKHWLG